MLFQVEIPYQMSCISMSVFISATVYRLVNIFSDHSIEWKSTQRLKFVMIRNIYCNQTFGWWSSSICWQLLAAPCATYNQNKYLDSNRMASCLTRSWLLFYSLSNIRFVFCLRIWFSVYFIFHSQHKCRHALSALWW